MTAQDQTKIVCAHCRKGPLTTRFEITHHQPGRSATANVCSLICLAQWSYVQTTTKSVQLALGVRSAVQNIARLLKGGS